VGLAGIIRRPRFWIVVSYLAIALLSIGTLIGFAPGGAVVQLLAANPYVVVADGVPAHFVNGYPIDLFGSIKVAVRSAQLPPDLEGYSNCDAPGSCENENSDPSAQQVIDQTAPVWFVGLGIHLALAVGALGGAIAVTNSRSRRPAAASPVT
jgi:ABC-2 type transport system permease protein